MSAVCTEGQTTNPEILAIADRVATGVRLSILRGRDAFNHGSPNALPQKSIERDTFDFLTKYQAVNRPAVDRLAGLTAVGGRLPHLAVPGPLRAFANVNFAAPETVLEQAKTIK